MTLVTLAISSHIYFDDSRFEVGEGPGIRIDSSCVGTRHQVTPFYDSLLCKVIATGSDHADACTKMARSLDEFVIEGLQ